MVASVGVAKASSYRATVQDQPSTGAPVKRKN